MSLVLSIYKRALNIVLKKPLRLWGISLLAILLISIGSALFGLIPGIALSIAVLIYCSMLFIFLDGYRGNEVQVTSLFNSFRDWNTVKRILGGMGWMLLWVFIWGLIPIVGPIFAIIKLYEYRLTPYILIQEPEVGIMEAIKVSSKRTNGFKLKMFLADFLVVVAVLVIASVLSLFALIPFIGVLFGIVLFVFNIAVAVLCPLFFGLVQAAFYEEINR